MNKSFYIEELSQEIKLLDVNKLKELANYVKFLKFRDNLDSSYELISDENFAKKIRQGISEMERGELVSWESIR